MNQVSRQEVLFYFGYICYLSAASFWGNVYSPLSKCLKVIGIAILIIACINAFLKNKKNIFLKNIALVSYILFLSLTIDIKLAVLFVFIYAFYKCNFTELVKIDFIVRTCGFLGTVFLTQVGIIDDYILSMYRGTTLVNRYSLGYAHPNNCFLMFFIIAVDYILIRMMKHKKIEILDVAVIVLSASYINSFTDCRAGFGLLILLTIAVFVETQFKVCKKNNWFARGMCYSSFGCLVLSIILVIIYEKIPTVGNVLNNFFTKRISSMAYFYNEYGISLFGNLTKRVSTAEAMAMGTRALVLDNLYANLLICYGVIFCIIYIWCHLRLCKLMIETKHYEYLLVFSIFSVYGLFEGVALNIDYYYFIVLACNLFYNNSVEELKETLNTSKKVFQNAVGM